MNKERTENLRKFHNWIKLQLILKSDNKNNLLDVACGRGGDLIKWSKAKIKYVTAFDSDAHSLYEKNEFDGAIKRYSCMKSIPNMPKVFFWNISAIDPKVLHLINSKDNGRMYDIVSCQFSMHYFVKEIDIVLNMISKKLNTGGHFIGTATDGDLIKATGNVDNDILKVNIISEEMYTFELFSGNTDRETYFQINGTSTEYFLHKSVLIDKCKEYGLEPVSILNFSEWMIKYSGPEMSQNEQIASFLNFSFRFVKI
jgi:mRNA (guanine-N7-)-methyltransferase